MINTVGDAGPTRGAQALLPMEEIDRITREIAVRRELIPLECRSSWLIPRQSASGQSGAEFLYLTGFLYPVTGLAAQPKRVGRPRFRWTFEARTGRLVELVDCRYSDFAAHIESDDIVGTLTPDLLPARTVPGLEQFRAEVLKTYDSVLPIVFASPLQMSPEEASMATQFRQLLKRGIEPFLEPFYRALNPMFFDWLEQF